MHYRRADATGGTYFFTVNVAERRSDVLVRHIDNLRAAMKTVKDAHPFAILAMVVLPEHLQGSRGGWQKASTFVPAAKPSVSEVSGSDGIGNIKFGMRLILRGTSITFITIP